MTKHNVPSASPHLHPHHHPIQLGEASQSTKIDAVSPSSSSSSTCSSNCSTSLHPNFVSSSNYSQQMVNDKHHKQPTYKSTSVPRKNVTKQQQKEKKSPVELTSKSFDSDCSSHINGYSFMDYKKLIQVFFFNWNNKVNGVHLSLFHNFSLFLILVLITLISTIPSTLAALECSEDQFACLDGKNCLPKSWKCDNRKDCQDGSDELGCSKYFFLSFSPALFTFYINY